MNSYSASNAQPSHIGHYEIGATLGRGGMGLVYLARDTRLGRQVAIKCLRTDLFEEHYRERFKREAMLLAKLNHPHIVQIYDFVESPDQLALVMEYVDGQNLQKQLREQLVPFSQRLQWLTQIAQGLAIAHDAGIIHRDLKPENILINKRGDAKISDLGIAKSQDYNATLTDHVAGSYCSMSPEQAMGESISFKSDLFSLGILAYQLLCGAHPFGDTSNKLQVMQRIISHPPVPPTKHNPDLAPDIINLLGQLLSKNPDNRPDNTHWVAAQFEQLNKQHQEQPLTLDDTLALTAPAIAVPTSGTGYTRSPLRNTQEHPTFDTAYINQAALKPGLGSRLKTYCKANAASLSMLGLALVLVGAIAAWQLQPKPPQYVAVIPPTLSADGMQESQQELVKGAVYDAIQQSVIQLDGYYLIPRIEVADVNGDLLAVQKATAADELITADIRCQIDACSINLSRLSPESGSEQTRLKVEDTKSFDVLTEDYLWIANAVQKNIGWFYSAGDISSYTQTQNQDYRGFLEVSQEYVLQGASDNLLEKLEQVGNRKSLEEISTLYRDIALDLHYENTEAIYIEKLTRFLNDNTQNPTQIPALINQYYLQLAEQRFNDADNTIASIYARQTDDALQLFLKANLYQAKNDYQKAIETYRILVKLKPTAINYQNLAIAYWYSGKLDSAKTNLTKALSLSPLSYKANQIRGAIALSEGDTQSAIISFGKITDKRKNPTDISNLGIAHLLAGNLDAAALYLAQAHQLAPNNIVILLNWADAENLRGEKQQATEKYLAITTRVNADTLDANELRSKVLAHAHLGEFSDAIRLLKQLQKLDQQNIDTLYTATIVYTLANEEISALTNIEEALDKKLNAKWFDIPWFDSLCDQPKFISLMKNNGAPQRCPI